MTVPIRCDRITLSSGYSSLRPMAKSYLSAQKQRYRITLELSVLDDFNPHQLDWNKLFDLEPNESVESYVEDLSVRW